MALPIFAVMTDPLDDTDLDRNDLREKLAIKVGREVEGVASVRPATRDGWISWAGLGVDGSLEPVLTAAVAITATFSAQERRRARATGLATRMALAVTAHDAHLFRTRAMGRTIGDHILTVPYGMVTQVTVGRKASDRIVASFVKVTIELADGSTIKLDGNAKDRRLFERLRTHARAVPVGTVPPPPEHEPAAGVARVLASAGGHVARVAAGAAGQVRAARRMSK